MPGSEMRFETPNGRKHLVQLCKHFGHKIEVEYSETQGRYALPSGPALLTADDRGLSVVVEAEDANSLERSRRVIGDHLRRLAFRETPEDIVWTEPASPA